MRIIFMGSSEFSLAPFLGLANSCKHQIMAVFTKAPRRKGRGLKFQENIIHKKSLERNIPTYVFPNLEKNEVSELISSIEADIIVVVAYDKKIPPKILYSKKYGAINIHPSLLPKYRGASPVQHTILNRDTVTAVCIIQMDENFDTGNILIEEKFYIEEEYNYVDLSRELSILGSNLLLRLLGNLQKFPPIPQSSQEISYCYKIDKNFAEINWKSEHVKNIDAKIRAFFPYIRFHLEFHGKIFQIIKSKILMLGDHFEQSGALAVNPKISQNLLLYCVGGILELVVIKPNNSKEIFAKDFINGLKGNKNGFNISQLT